MMIRLFFVIYVASTSFLFGQDPLRFEEEVKEINNRYVDFNSENTIIFTGSSSIRLWKDLNERFPDKNIINTGFGGSHTSDLLYYADQLIFKYSPKQVFIYEGDNDLAGNKKPKMVLKDTKKLIKLIQNKLPECSIILISPKPSIKRWDIKDQYEAYIQLLSLYLTKHPDISFINIWEPMLNKNQKPIADIFIEDNLHMNKKGYDIWEQKIQPYLL